MRSCLWLLVASILCQSALGSNQYAVRKGDTLYRISHHFHLTVEQLVDANRGKITLHTHLKIGQRLLIPAPGRFAASPKSAPAPAGAVLYVDRRKTHPAAVPDEETDEVAANPTPGSAIAPAPAYLFINRIMGKLNAPSVKSGRWKYVVVHHSGTVSGNARIFDYFHRHVRGMENGLAYHFVIGNGHDSGDGEIEVGNRWTKQLQGGHLHSDSLNMISLGICFVGDFNRDRPTKKQIAACLELIGYLNRRCGKPPIFKLHREINPRPTDCPGDLFPGKAFHQLFDQ